MTESLIEEGLRIIAEPCTPQEAAVRDRNAAAVRDYLVAGGVEPTADAYRGMAVGVAFGAAAHAEKWTAAIDGALWALHQLEGE